MWQRWMNWRTVLVVVAITITCGTVIYSNYLSEKLKTEQRKKVEAWVEAQKTLLQSGDKISLNLAAKISADNDDIPIIETDEHEKPTGNYINLDSADVTADKNFLSRKIIEFKLHATPIEVVITSTPYIANKYFYGESRLQQQIRYYPMIQLAIAALFIIILVVAQHNSYQNTQNKLWAGMAKETAHQLGTPVSSLEGWVEILKEKYKNESFVFEMEKDVNRLLLVTDRFGKIGSKPSTEKKNIIHQIQQMVDYVKKRAGGYVAFVFNSQHQNIELNISPSLFDWVIENLLKNALDAMEGKGKIEITIAEKDSLVEIKISDTGKGIAKKDWGKIFKPGFSTKQRGWGLGLTLTKRIVEEYHHGKIYVSQSDINVGTTFCIEFNKSV